MIKEWITKAEQKIPICKMEDKHLINSIRMLERFYKNYCLDYAAVVGSAYPDGEPDGAAMAAESEERYFMEEAEEMNDIGNRIPSYEALIKEAEKRKLIYD